MRIAFVGNALTAGGAQKMLAFAISCVADMAEEILVILEDGNNMVHQLPDNTKVALIEYKGRENTFGKVMRISSYVRQTRKLLVDNRIDVVCGFGNYYAMLAVLAAKRLKIKVIGTERRAPQELNAVWKMISKYAYTHCDRMAFQLQGAKEFYKGIPNEKASIIPNPYLQKQDVVPCESSKRRKAIAMAAARLEYEKGFDVGIRAMEEVVKKHPDYIMEIYGAGDFDGMYGEIIRECGIEKNVVFKGLSKNIISDILDVKVFVLPSRSEGIPNMLLEAMGAGVPCVGADCPPGGPRMLLGNNERGILVKVGNVVETAEAINMLIENQELSVRLSENAQTVKEEFSIVKIKEEWQKCFREVMR